MDHKIPSLSSIHAISTLLVLVLLSSLFLLNIYTPLQPLYLLRFAFRTSFFSSSPSPPSSLTITSAVGGLTNCDYSNGKWVWDENYGNEFYSEEDCAFLDPGFKCTMNGRKETGYRNWRWQPNGCNLPRFEFGFFIHSSMFR